MKNIFIDVSAFNDKSAFVMALKVINTKNDNKDLSIYLKANESEVNTLRNIPSISILPDSSFDLSKEVSIVSSLASTTFSFYLKPISGHDKFLSYLFIYDEKENVDSILSSLNNTITIVKKLKNKDDIKLAILKENEISETLNNKLKDKEEYLKEITTKELLKGEADIILISKKTFNLLSDFIEALNYKPEEKKSKNVFSDYLFKNYTSKPQSNLVTLFPLPYSLYIKDDKLVYLIEKDMTYMDINNLLEDIIKL